MKRIRTSMRLLAAAAATLACASFVTAVPAGANEGEKVSIRISGDDKVKKRYDGMPVNDAGSNFTSDPETCAAAPFCTLVPLEVILPADFNPDVNEFVLTVKLLWNDSGVSAGGQAAQGNDLDMYIYHEEKDAKGKVTYREVGRSAGSKQPEVSKLFTPAQKDYLIIVYNFLGVNEGFDLDVSYRDASIEDLPEFEGAAPAARPGSSGGGSGSGGDDLSPDAGESFRPSASPSRPTFRSPSMLPSAPDTFTTNGAAGFGVPTSAEDATVFDLPTGSEKDLAKDLAAGEQSQDVFKRREASLHPEPASGVLLGFWLGVVPIALLGVAAVVMLRRRPVAMTLQLPRATSV